MLIYYGYKMMNFLDHATESWSIFNFNNLRDFVKTKCFKGCFLILWRTDFTLNLFYFNCCHFFTLIIR